MWAIWIVIGIICMILEISTPGFIFASIGLGAIVTGILALKVSNIPIQIGIFAILTMTTFVLMRRLAKFLLKPENLDSNVFALVGKTGVVTKSITPDKHGYVKIEGEEWAAMPMESNETFSEGCHIEIVETRGNKVYVKRCEN